MNPIALLAIGVGLFLMSPSQRRKAALTEALDDNSKLLARATQPKAAEWAHDFEAAGATPAVAAALSRWVGIESGGNPMSHSVLDERGLLQVGHENHKDGAVSDAEWEMMLNPNTSRADHAAIALKAWSWYADRAKKYVGSMPTEAIDRIWYAKLYHQRPKDLANWKLHGPARLMSMSMEPRLANGQPKTAHRLHAANVIAFGNVSPVA